MVGFDLENFEQFKIKLQNILQNFSLTRGIKSDVVLNYKKLKKLEAQLWDLDFETIYESLSPKINTASIEIYPKNEALADFIRNDESTFEFFENLAGRTRYSVSFDHLLFSKNYSQELNKEAFSVLNYLDSELETGSSYLLKTVIGFEQSVLNLIAQAVKEVEWGGQNEKDFLTNLLFDLNLALVLLSPEMSKKQDKDLFNRLYIMKPENKFTNPPKIFQGPKQTISELIVTHVFSKDGDLVTDEDEIFKILETESKKANNNIRELLDKAFPLKR